MILLSIGYTGKNGLIPTHDMRIFNKTKDIFSKIKHNCLNQTNQTFNKNTFQVMPKCLFT